MIFFDPHKGFAINDELLKNAGGGNYFDELLARIRDIRSTSKECFHATYENAMEEINNLKARFGESSLFGNEKDQSFHSSIG